MNMLYCTTFPKAGGPTTSGCCSTISCQFGTTIVSLFTTKSLMFTVSFWFRIWLKGKLSMSLNLAGRVRRCSTCRYTGRMVPWTNHRPGPRRNRGGLEVGVDGVQPRGREKRKVGDAGWVPRPPTNPGFVVMLYHLALLNALVLAYTPWSGRHDS